MYLTELERGGTKTEKASTCAPGRHWLPEGRSPSPPTFISALWDLQEAHRAAGLPLVAGDYLFRPQSKKSGEMFSSGHLSSDAIYQRFKKLLQDAGLYENESLHSLRRGKLQSLIAAGVPLSEVMVHGHIASESTVLRYVDPTRHLRGEKGEKRKRAVAP